MILIAVIATTLSLAGAVDTSRVPANQMPASLPAPGLTYVLGPDDLVSVEVAELADAFTSKSYRIDADGTVSLPYTGRIRAGGLTLAQFEAVVTERLRSQVLEPHVTATIAESHSQPVSVMGAVNTPGVYQLQGGRRLLDVLSLAGGLKPESSDYLTLSRRADMGAIPVAGAHPDPDGHTSSVNIRVNELFDSGATGVNVTLRPYDTILVPRAEMVYVVGDVQKAGSFPLSQSNSMSALEAVSLAQGFTPSAAPQKARVLREIPGQPNRKQQIPVDLRKLLAGRAPDVQLQANDVLYVPNSRATQKGAELVLRTISGFIIWHGI
ncbi:MAG TPA: polysaccharide biosynthesis/export family protein [Bryobacteraceae bacterium]|nr:polysaccharide biosynthesis/export family protein [Bryobacteraceae bacterium]